MDAIADLKARGLRVVLYPFVMMDIPGDNTLPDRDGNIGQATYPWRGRIGPASTDGAVASQISALVGTSTPGHFSAGSGVPVYSGPSEWSFRRFILHLAALSRNAGGVDAFLIGSELVDLTMATDTLGQYPFVDALVTLAGDVKTMLPAAQISYAADWSEYHSHRVGGEVHFHLDPLWASADVDFIGIDNYLPLSDWRPGNTHADYDPENGVTSVYSLDYLKGQIEGGEFWDYYYTSQADRDTQTRTPIWDGAHGEDWVFRQKAIRAWHGAAHHNRPGGVRDVSSTAWVPGSKPVWSLNLAVRQFIWAPTNPMCFTIPRPRNPTCRIIPVARGMTSCSANTCAPCWNGGERTAARCCLPKTPLSGLGTPVPGLNSQTGGVCARQPSSRHVSQGRHCRSDP